MLKQHVDAALLAELFCINAGVVTWRSRPRDHFTCDRTHSMWNTRYANRPAGRIDKFGYVLIHLTLGVSSVTLKAHRVAWALVTGEWPKSEIDHINGVRSDNRIENLRLATRTQNCQNRAKRVDCVCQSKGVTYNRRMGLFQARIQVHGVSKFLGSYPTEQEASDAYQSAANKAFGEFHRR